MEEKRIYITTSNGRRMLKTTAEKLKGFQIDGNNGDSGSMYLGYIIKK